MADLLAISSDIIDKGADHGPVNRITHELSEIGDRLAVVEAFSHSIIFDTDEGLVVFDTSGTQSGDAVVEAIRGWRKTPFRHLIYTHGHIDHVGGSGFFLADARRNKHARPQVTAHAGVPERFARYRLTNGYNKLINARQFKGFGRRGYGIGGDVDFLPEDVAEPDMTYRDSMKISAGNCHFDLYHARGETDDHTWAWVPRYKAICAGDFFIWNFPNAGNPQKVQRYPVEWAKALRSMADKGAELFIPAHGLPIEGQARISYVLKDVAGTLETVIEQTLSLMNEGATRNDIIHQVRVADEQTQKPWLRPLYDEPEFVVNNLWRQFGGWYDGNPAHLKPAKEQALAKELVSLAGDARALINRALALAEKDSLRLACHLIEWVVQAESENREAHAARALIYQQRRDQETSLMAKGIFGYTANESKDKAGEE